MTPAVARRMDALDARLLWRTDVDFGRFRRYRHDPVGFCRQVLGVEPWERQAEILTALALEPRVSVRSCHGAGKTTCAAWAALWFLQTRPGSIVITTAPTGRQVKDLLWRRIRVAFRQAKEPLVGRCLTTFLEASENWYATGFSTDREVSFQGPHSPAGVLFVGDEASGLPEWLFQAAAGFATEEGAKQLLIGNPNLTAGTFYESQRRWPPSQRFHISAFDVPPHVLRPSWAAEQAEEWGEDSAAYQVRVLGEFPTEGPDSLIAMTWAEAAQQRLLEDKGEVVIGVDLARFGSDESVAYVRRGPAVIAADYWRKADTMASAGRLVAMARAVGAKRIQVDVIGLGAGTVDRLKEEGLPVIGVNVAEAALDPERYANLRTELFFNLAERFRAGSIDIPAEDTELLAQLTSLRFRYTSKGQYALESKDDMKKRGLKSPDRADALALTYGAIKPANPLAGVGIIAGIGVKGWMAR